MLYIAIIHMLNIAYANIHSYISFGVVLYGGTGDSDLLNDLCPYKELTRTVFMNLNR